MQRSVAGPPGEIWLRRAAAVSLVVAAVAQLIGQVVLRLPSSDAPSRGGGSGSEMWVVSHVVLVVAALGLLAAGLAIALLVGFGPGTWAALAALVVGQSLLLAVLAIDLGVAVVEVDAIRTLDTWDFLGVVGIVVLLLELRRRRGAGGPGADLALLGLAIPPIDGLVVIAAGVVVLGFAALAYELVAGRGRVGRSWPVGFAVMTIAGYAAASVVSWQRAALAVVVVAWTVRHLRTARDSARSEAP